MPRSPTPRAVPAVSPRPADLPNALRRHSLVLPVTCLETEGQTDAAARPYFRFVSCALAALLARTAFAVSFAAAPRSRAFFR